MRQHVWLAAVVLAWGLFPPAPSSARLRAGDIVLLYQDSFHDEASVKRFDRTTGGTEFISGTRSPERFALAQDGSLVGIEEYSVVRIDLASGATETVSSMVRGAGPFSPDDVYFGWLTTDIGVATDDTIWIAGQYCCLLQVDPATGDRTDADSIAFAISPGRLAFEPGSSMLLTYYDYSYGGFGGEHFISEGLQRFDPIAAVPLSTILATETIGTNSNLMLPYAQNDLAVTPDGRIYTSVGGGSRVEPRIMQVDAVAHSRATISGAGVGAGPAWVLPGTLLAPSNAELVVFDGGTDSIVSVDLTTGDRSVVSGAGVGTGPACRDLVGVEAGGGILGYGDDGFLRIDPLSGDRSLVYATNQGSGPPIHDRMTVLAADARTLVTATESDLLRVDAASGDRSLTAPSVRGAVAVAERRLANGESVLIGHVDAEVGERSVVLLDESTGDVSTLSGPDTGSGPLWTGAIDVAVGPAGIYVLDADAVLRVDPETGARTVVSDASTGAGESFGSAAAIATTPQGQLYVLGPRYRTGSVEPGLFRIDTSNGDRTRVTSLGAPLWWRTFDLSGGNGGELLAIASAVPNPSAPRTLYAIDPVAGTRVPVGRGGIGAVAVVPEPDSFAVAVVAIAVLLAGRPLRSPHGALR
jgi:hypothetical protein